MRVLIALLALSASCDATEVLGPPWFQQALAYYEPFDREGAAMADGPTISAAVPGARADGFIGPCLNAADDATRLVLRGEAVSPHQPVTLSFWWALPYDLAIDGGYYLFDIRGKGYIALFCRGKGEWCALERPAGVFQVYYFPDIQDVNGIYDFDLLSRYDLSASVWHHTAVVFRRSSTAEVYVDGEQVYEITVKGRDFSADHELETLTFGAPLLLDEVALLNRAVDGAMIGDYVRGMRQLREYVVGPR